ncbi:MAG: hypothetical protein ACK5GP_01610 [bacterium]|jgi:hypothetical protein|nr:hypothetical protein [Chitinophagaceae bacterium]
MKKLFTSFAFFLFFAAISNNAAAQRMFDALPETAKFLPSAIEGIFNMNPGTAVDVKFTQGFHVTGVVKSNKKVYENLQTVVIESSNYKANLFISKTIDQDNKIKYVGRMLGRGFQDGIEFKMDNAGNNIIKKINLKDMIVE